MASVVINGPVVGADTDNQVLRAALFHSTTERLPSATNYHVIEIGVREGAYTSWIGTWNQSTQKVDAATPTSVLNEGRADMRLKAGQAIVVRVTAYGTPATLSGSRINFTLGLVGGRDGTAKPLVASGAAVADPNSRVAIAALERQINTGGLADWDEAVQITDPVGLVTTGTFQGRLQRDSATQISVQRFSGNWIEVDGEAVSIGSTGLAISTTQGLISDGGTITATAPSSSTLYYVYVGSPVDGVAQLRLCATAPTSSLGVYSLGTSAAQRRWRFVGWVRTNASTQFVDTTTDRLVVNYYNRQPRTIVLNPAYSDGNTATTFTTTSTTWTAANAGTGATASYIATGEDAIYVTAFSRCDNSGANTTLVGIGDNSGSNCASEATMVGSTAFTISCSYSVVPATGYRTLVLLVRVTAGTGTYRADDVRGGSAADPVGTALYAEILA